MAKNQEIKIRKLDESGNPVLDSKGNYVYETEVGILGLFQPQDWDVAEEVNVMDSFREYQRDISDRNMGDSF